MTDIFLSYANADLERARKLAKALEARGWSVWWDRKLTPGRNFRREIQRHLDAARCVVVLWTTGSVESEWVEEEALRAKQRDCLVPVLLDDVLIPLGFGMRQAAGLIGWSGQAGHAGFEALVRAVAAHLDTPGTDGAADKTMAPPRSDGSPLPARMSLRSRPADLSEGQVRAMLEDRGFFDRHGNELCRFANDLSDNGDGTLTDHATGLTWQQAGSVDRLGFKSAQDYVTGLNRDGFAGHRDWRLPTLEEGASLLQPERRDDGLYIDPLFDSAQRWIWTADETGSGAVWVVRFYDGDVDRRYFDYDLWVRVCRAAGQ